ncbi:hypothetical protein [Corynebacterium flavescens]|uniref:hypothetical protein n=1 Tax=Corynebacterium flavescens TaxID=28028 RepID=UPI000EDBF086|nr:hypothetical protein [Corynebacterium flavescens]
MQLPLPGNAAHRYPLKFALAVMLAVSATVFLIATLKLPGLVIALALTAAAWLMFNSRPASSEQIALRNSIRLSAEDLQDVIIEFQDFELSEDTEAIADRTLHRPALLDLDCASPDIEAFHFDLAGARRFLRRLNTRLQFSSVTNDELETLLKVTDKRATELKDSWLLARKAALALGTDYNRRKNQD